MKQLRFILRYLFSFLPERLPVGTTTMEKFMLDIIELAGGYADKDSMRYAIASMMIHAPAHYGMISKHYFIVRLRKSAANQIASQVFQEIKLKQAELEAKAKQEAEDTAKNKAVSNGQQQN